MAQHMEVRPGVEQEHFRHAYSTTSPGIPAYQTPAATSTYVGGGKTPSPQQPVYSSKRNDSVHTFNPRDLSQHPSYSSSYQTHTPAVTMNSSQNMSHQHSLSHNQYAANSSTGNADATQTQSQNHVAHSSVSAATARPNYYSHASYTQQHALGNDSSPESAHQQAHGHANHSSISNAPAHSYYQQYSHQQNLANETAQDGTQAQTHGHAPHSSVSSAASAPTYYPHYSHQQSLQGAMPSYVPNPMAVPRYASYAGGMGAITPASTNGMQTQMMHQSPPGMATGGAGSSSGHESMDTTGQVAPHGVKPRVTATLWEDEATLCFQVETNGICVARREDNHMINGTKLLNVAGMTRGRRDGILKSEKNRAVVKIGPMHLKGVWIPFERALEFANKEKITERLYPLFVHNIGSLLYHQPGSAASRPGVAASTAPIAQDARRPSISQHHHHSMSASSMTPAMSMSSASSSMPPMWSPSTGSQKRGMDFDDDEQNAWKRARLVNDDPSRTNMIQQQQR